MKKILLLSTIIAGLFISCEDFLTKNPLNFADETNVWKTEKDAVQGVNSAYACLNSAFDSYVLNDMYTPIADETSTGEINLGLHTARTGMFNNYWRRFYLGVNLANIALEKLPLVNMNSQLQNRLAGECKFLRALYYFNLIDFFGDVPLYLEEITVQNAYESRTSVSEIRSSVILKDLEDAIAVLDINYSSPNVGRATKGAAIALKGKTYLYAGDYENAIKAFEEIINNKETYGYDLLPNYKDVFDYNNKNNKEVIFDVQYLGPKMGKGSSLDYLLGNLSSNGTGSNNSSCPTVELLDMYWCADGLPISSSPLYDSNDRYNNRDKRLDITIIRPGSTYKDLEYTFPLLAGDYVKGKTRTGLMWRKYVVEDDGSAWGDDNQNFILIRYADILLMYAEAKNELLGQPDEQIYNALNAVRERAGVQGIISGSKTKDEMRQLIRTERMLELACEGIIYSDIRRWKIAGQLLNGRQFKNLLDEVYMTRVFDENKHYLWPIPQQEIDMNNNLTQNPGY